MTKAERNKIAKWARSLSNDELERKAYDAVFACLGSEAEEMYERGYDERDIREREKYERDLEVIADILESVCDERGIKLWEDANDPT